MARRAVIFSTDGLRDYVTTPDGVKYMLGPVSVLQVVTKLVPRAHVRQVLDEFNASSEVMAILDTDALFEMLAPPKRRLLSYDRSTYPSSESSPSERHEPMAAEDKSLTDAIANQVAQIERQIDVLQQKAKDSGGAATDSMKNDIAALQDLITWLKRPSAYGDQSKNETFYGLKGGTPGGAKSASYDTLKENETIAQTVLSQVAETSETVVKLASQGRKFNATKALTDLHAISSRVAEMLEHVDLAESWVTKDLQDLATKSAHIHGLFAGAK